MAYAELSQQPCPSFFQRLLTADRLAPFCTAWTSTDTIPLFSFQCFFYWSHRGDGEFQTFRGLTGSKYVWRGAAKQSIANCIANDTGAQWAKVVSELEGRTTDLEGVTHHDGWEDAFRRDWLGVMMSYLAPGTGEPRDIWFGVVQLSQFANAEDGGKKSALVMRNALLSKWKECFAPRERYLDAVDKLPPLVLSDNTGSAVKVAKDAGRQSARCAVHILYIIVRRLCYSTTSERLMPPRPPCERDLCPELLAALEILRTWAVYLTDADVFEQWERLGLGGAKHEALHLDSPTDWDSCLELCEAGLRRRGDIETMKWPLRRTVEPWLPTTHQK